MSTTNTAKKSTRVSVTGRDGYIVMNALAYAIVIIGMLPRTHQEASDCEDMQLLLRHLVHDPHLEASFIANAKRHLTVTDGVSAVLLSNDNIIKFPD